MKKKYILIVVIIFLMGICFNVYSKNNGKCVVLSSKTYLYKSPSKKSGILKVFTTKEKLYMISMHKNFKNDKSFSWVKVRSDKGIAGYVLKKNVFILNKLFNKKWKQTNKLSRLTYSFFKNNTFIFKINYKKNQNKPFVTKIYKGSFKINGNKITLNMGKTNKSLYLFKLGKHSALSPFNFPAGSKVPKVYLFTL